MEKISQSLQDVLSHVRGDAAVSPCLRPPIVDTSPAQDEQVWQPQQPLPEVALFAPSPAIEQLSPSLTIQVSGAGLDLTGTGLPPKDILQELIDLFFDLIYPWAPLFNKLSFIANINSPGRQILLHGVVVTAFRFWTKENPAVEVREAYTKSSREQILLKTIDTCSLISTQALALLAVDAIGQGPGPRTWNMMAMLNTAAKQLSLARSPSLTNSEANTPLVRNEDPDDDVDTSSIEAEEKRRLFWVIYSLDRFSSVSHGQPGAIDTKTIRLTYPADDQEWGQPVASEWFQAIPTVKRTHSHPTNLWHHYIDLLALMDRTNQLLIQPVNLSLPAHCQEWQSSFRRLDITLTTWFENLPREVREPPRSFDPMWIMIHATFHL